MYGTRIAFLIGISTAVIVAGVGTLVGIVAGYRGGYVENLFMRVVDTAYGLPFLPFAIVLIMVLGRGNVSVVLAISALLWRDTARVIRSEVVSIKEQPMIDAAIASGASDTRIILYYIFPKVLPITMLYSVFAVGWAIIAEAGLSFIGFGDPESISWGRVLNNAHTSNAIQQELWLWIIAPGAPIILFVWPPTSSDRGSRKSSIHSYGVEENEPRCREPLGRVRDRGRSGARRRRRLFRTRRGQTSTSTSWRPTTRSPNSPRSPDCWT